MNRVHLGNMNSFVQASRSEGRAVTDSIAANRMPDQLLLTFLGT